jgi:hypothetical protein
MIQMVEYLYNRLQIARQLVSMLQIMHEWNYNHESHYNEHITQQVHHDVKISKHVVKGVFCPF